MAVRGLTFAGGHKLTGERLRFCLAFVERLLELLLLSIGNLLGLQYGIFALARYSEIAGRDLILAGGRKLTGERLRSCLAFVYRLLQLLLLGIGNLLGLQYGLFALAHYSEIAVQYFTLARELKPSRARLPSCLAFVERLLELLLLGIGNLLGLQYGLFALAHCSEIAGRDLTFASGRKLAGARLRFCLLFVERLLQLLLLGIGNLLGLQCLCGILALAHCNEIAGRDLTFASGRRLTGERLRFCLALVERLLQFLLPGIGNLLGLQYGIFALARSSEIAGRDLILACGRKLTCGRLRSCLAFVERLLQLLLPGIGDLLGLQCLCGILALAHCNEIAGRDIILAGGRKLTGERLRSCLAFVERLLQLLLLGIGNLLGLQYGIFVLAHCSEIAGRDLTFASGFLLMSRRLR